MDKVLAAAVVIFSVFTSGIASMLVFDYLEHRDRRLRERLAELENEEDYLGRIHRDERKLNRSTYSTILMALCIAFLALALWMGALAFGLPADTMRYIHLVCAWLFLVAAGMCFHHVRSIMRIADFERTRERIRQEKLRLEDRLR